MDPIDINYLIKKSPDLISQANIARKLKINRATVNQVIHRRIKSKRVSKYIAAKLGLKVKDLWPDAA